MNIHRLEASRNKKSEVLSRLKEQEQELNAEISEMEKKRDLKRKESLMVLKEIQAIETQIEEYAMSLLGRRTCTSCGGRGKLDKDYQIFKCPPCGGKGWVPTK